MATARTAIPNPLHYSTERLQSAIPAGQGRKAGTVNRWGNGWGFIQSDAPGLAAIFAHYRNIRPLPGVQHRALIPGQRVTFHIAVTDKGLSAMDIAAE